MKTFLITGATRGLGLETARALAADRSHRVVLAVRDEAAGRSHAATIGGSVDVVRLDLCSLDDVESFVGGWRDPLAGLVNNAGIQITNETRTTRDGFEETIGVNHLAAVALTVGLLPHLGGGRVLFIGSGTHNPENRLATVFGFRGARFTSIEELARGGGAADSVRQLGMDRYATSKFLNTVTPVELARRYAPEQTAFFTLDPGLMPGTGLARTAPAVQRALWSSVLRWIGPLLPDTSTPARSGATAAWIMTSPDVAKRSGEIFSYDRKPSTRVWKTVRDPQVGKRAVDDTIALLAARRSARGGPKPAAR